MSEIVHYLGGLTLINPEDDFALAIQRSDVLGSALHGIDRKAFSPHKQFKVSLVHGPKHN